MKKPELKALSNSSSSGVKRLNHQANNDNKWNAGFITIQRLFIKIESFNSISDDLLSYVKNFMIYML